MPNASTKLWGQVFSVFWILLIVIHLFMDTELHFHVSGFVSGQYGRAQYYDAQSPHQLPLHLAKVTVWFAVST